MLKTKSAIVLAGLLALVVPACSPKAANTAAATPAAATPPAATPMADMPAMPASPAAADPIVGVGKVLAVDIPDASIRLDHGPIPALGWTGMTMTFTATDPAMLDGVKVGDTVSFEIKSKTENSSITKVTKQ